ncbi:hypothetical protein D3C85_1567270 [compost metagenome]
MVIRGASIPLVTEEISKTELAFGVTVPIPICAFPISVVRQKNTNRIILLFCGVEVIFIVW